MTTCSAFVVALCQKQTITKTVILLLLFRNWALRRHLFDGKTADSLFIPFKFLKVFLIVFYNLFLEVKYFPHSIVNTVSSPFLLLMTECKLLHHGVWTELFAFVTPISIFSYQKTKGLGGNMMYFCVFWSLESWVLRVGITVYIANTLWETRFFFNLFPEPSRNMGDCYFTYGRQEEYLTSVVWDSGNASQAPRLLTTKSFHFPIIILKKGIFAKSKYQMRSMHHNRSYYVEESLRTCLPRTWQE